MKDNRRVIEKYLYWPTPIWHTVLKSFRTHPTRVNINDDLYSYIKGLSEKYETRKISNVGGWQSDLLNPNEQLKPLCDEIYDITKHLPLNIKEIQIPQIWANINNLGDYNIIHTHGGQYHLSGIYYVKLPENSGNIVFRDPRPSAMGNGLINERFDNGELVYPEVCEGSLLLWPSFLDHFVEPSKTKEDRVSISFDIVAR